MQYILDGFREAQGFRIFAFEGIAADRTRSAFSVRTDLALARRYGIRLQELPLLCRGLLDKGVEEGKEDHAFTYTEEDMCQHAGRVAAREEAAKKNRPPRRPIPAESAT